MNLNRFVFQIDTVVPFEVLFLLLILGAIIVIWDKLMRESSSIRTSGGLGEKSELIALSGSDLVPARSYSSEKLQLSSQPHGIVKEGGFIIPVDVIPSTNKVRDRHVIQLMVHMRLIEEVEGRNPPYGLLIMGKEKRSVRVKNSEEKQRWLDTILDEMRSIVDDGVPVVPSPTFYKCKGCDVRAFCEFSAVKDKT